MKTLYINNFSELLNNFNLDDDELNELCDLMEWNGEAALPDGSIVELILDTDDDYRLGRKYRIITN